MVTIAHETFEAAQRGDGRAITLLLECAQPDIRRYARATCRSAVDAEDATQETLWQLSRHVGIIRSFASFPAWLWAVARRECLRLARKAGLIATIDEVALEQRLAARSDHALRLDLAAAFEALPPHYREVALMRDLKEMTISEIGEACGITRAAVKARLHRARLLLREYLAE